MWYPFEVHVVKKKMLHAHMLARRKIDIKPFKYVPNNSKYMQAHFIFTYKEEEIKGKRTLIHLHVHTMFICLLFRYYEILVFSLPSKGACLCEFMYLLKRFHMLLYTNANVIRIYLMLNRDLYNYDHLSYFPAL